MKILFQLATFCCIFFLSCSKKELETSNTKNAEALAKNSGIPDYLQGHCPYPCTDTRCKAYLNGYCGSDTIAIIKNSNNPYDNAGQQHNNGVNSILPTIGSSNNIDSVVLIKVKSYLASIGYNSDSMQNFYNRAVQNGYFPFSHLQRLDSLGNTLHANGLLSSYGNSYVQQIYNYANQYLNTDTITAAKYNSFANSLVSLEATIKNDTRISAWEKEVILAGCSVGRYSGSYWGNYFSAGGGAQPLFLRRLSNWLRCVISDIGGAIVGIGGSWLDYIGGAIGTSVATAATLNWE